MKKCFTLHMPVGQALNYRCERGQHMFQSVCQFFIDTDENESLESQLNQAFIWTQNDFNIAYSGLGMRSSSVGDIITCDQGHYMVVDFGFMEVPSAVTSYIDWGVVADMSPEQIQDLTLAPTIDFVEDYEL